MDNKEKSPEQELIESIGLMIEKGMESNTNIYTGVVKSVDGKRAVVTVNGQNQNVSIATADVSSGNVVRVFVPKGNMSAAFIIKAEASGGGEPTTTAYGDLTGKPQINGVTLIDNKTSKELNLYGTGNAPPYPVTSVNGQTGDVTIEVGGNVDSVNGKTGVVVLSATDVGALPNTTVIPDKTSQLDNDSGYITNSALTDYAKKTEIPTKTSELTNDSGYITNTALEPYAKTVDIPTKTSQLNNDSGYITANDVPVKSVDGATGNVVTNAVKTTTQTLTDAQKQQARTNIGAGTSSFDGDYNSLTNKPTIPTKTSQLTNDSGFITNAALTGYAKTTDIPTKTSQLDNDSHYITASEAPVQSVNTKTGAVVLTQDDVGDGATYVRTHNDFTDALKTQINTNEDNIAMLDGDVEGLQTDVGTLKTNVSSLQTALTSKQDVIVGAASTITDNNLVADRALISNSSGKVAVSNVTSTELGYLDGVTSNIQTQLNKKLEKAPVTSVNSKTGAVQLNASDVGALPDTTVIPSKTSQLDNDSGFITDIPIASATQLGGVKIGAGLSVTENGVLSATGGGTADAVEWNNVLDKPTTIAGYGITDAKIENGTITLGNKTITPLTSAPVTSVNSKTGAVVLGASDVGAISTSNISQTLGTSTTKVPSEKAVSDALSSAGFGDMLKSTYDPTGSVATAGGIPDYVEANGGKIDTIKVNGTVQVISDKTVNITVPTKTSDITNDSGYLTSAPVTSVNSKTGDVVLTANDVGALPDDTVIPTVNNATLTIRRNSIDVGSFTANSANDVNIDINVPTDKSDIGLGNVDNVKQYSASNPPPYPVTSVNGAIGEVKSTFYVTVTQGNGNTATADKTAEEVYEAYAAGYAVYAIANLRDYDVPTILPMSTWVKDFDQVALGFVALTGLDFVFVQCNGTAWSVMIGILASLEDIPTIPEYLPNPNALNIKIGDTTTSYDGSAAKTVEIPEGVPSVTTADNGKFLRVVNGAWAAVAIADANGVKF